jgi:type II secretory ATPase GspE/PulE/Tfp pilus assembly ATPase PilB-like protein
VGVYEVMEVTSEIRRLIHSAAPSHRVRDQMRRAGCLTLREEGILVAIQGKTTLEEVLSVTHTEDELLPQEEAVV